MKDEQLMAAARKAMNGADAPDAYFQARAFSTKPGKVAGGFRGGNAAEGPLPRTFEAGDMKK
ncbi:MULTISPECIES: hypothetical protein [unclassified Sporolactobacillus]|uniref:hypothetical protein n=1 Tax=unclassified Sporolactobacillus TaxID=2628533 RepID=UPI002367B790|nr:hypothetical protein [Sporolactobacillus sp. CQH2019]MDD9147584.1 hypothetical protein [Sporolactobacillus sp. CQH2019]